MEIVFTIKARIVVTKNSTRIATVVLVVAIFMTCNSRVAVTRKVIKIVVATLRAPPQRWSLVQQPRAMGPMAQVLGLLFLQFPCHLQGPPSHIKSLAAIVREFQKSGALTKIPFLPGG